MKKLLMITALILFSTSLYSENKTSNKFSAGLQAIVGGRYDDVRMCVSSMAGVRGGAIADLMIAMRYRFTGELGLTFHLPIMRPVLFGAAFSMVQIEPEIRFEITKPLSKDLDLLHGPGLGVSFHYGPDYTSDLENRDTSFFAAGPTINYSAGIGYQTPGNTYSVFSIRAFYIPLFSQQKGYGTVAGGVLEYTVYFMDLL